MLSKVLDFVPVLSICHVVDPLLCLYRCIARGASVPLVRRIGRSEGGRRRL